MNENLSLATNLLPSAAPGQTSSAHWTAGIVSAFVYLACLLARELAQSIVAMRRTVRVDRQSAERARALVKKLRPPKGELDGKVQGHAPALPLVLGYVPRRSRMRSRR